MFSYTSGTTGVPKGVMLSHKMILGSGSGIGFSCSQGNIPGLGPKDSYISYLPAAHSFEQCLYGCAITLGMKIGMFGGNVLKLTEDAQILKPTLFPSVPRLYNRIYGKIQDGIKQATGVKAWLVNKAITTKLENFRAGKGLTHPIYDALVCKKFKAILGGQVRIMVTGSAPMSPDVLDFLKIAFACDLCEGYGMTESSGGSVCTVPGDNFSGYVGGPVRNCKIRLRDLPEMGYLHTNDPPKGEIMFWGSGIMKGYFRNPEKTAEAIQEGGWLASGDVGMILPNGAIKIVDRAKNIFKLSQGEYIAPEKLENVYIQSEFLMQCWIYGDSLRDHCIAFVVLDPDRMARYSKETGKDAASLPDDEEVRDMVYASML